MKISSSNPLLLLLLSASFLGIATSSSAEGWYHGHQVPSTHSLSGVSFLRTLPNKQSSFRVDHEQNGNKVIANGDGHRRNRSAKSLLFTIPRGGDVGSISGHSFAVFLGGMAATDCIFALAPITMLKWLGIHKPNNKDHPNADVEEQKYYKLTCHYAHGVGSSAATITVLLLLRLLSSSTVSLEQALGWSFFVRLLSMTTLIVSGQWKELGMNGKLFDFTWMLLASMTALLLSGYQTDLAMSLTKAVSFLLAIHGYFLYTVPTAFVDKALNKGGTVSVVSKKTATKKGKKVHNVEVDSAGLATTINISGANGGYMAISGAVAYLLAHGLDAVEVAGYVAIGWIPILHRFLHNSPTDKIFGVDTGVWEGVISIVMAVIAIGCLSPAAATSSSTMPIPPIPVRPPTQPVA